MEDDAVYLRHIQEHIGRIEQKVRDGRDAFLAYHTFQNAVIRNLQTIANLENRDDAQPVRPHYSEELGIIRMQLMRGILGKRHVYFTRITVESSASG